MSTDAEFNSEGEETRPNVNPLQETSLEDAPPRELESALLSVALFGGLILFGIGCMVFGWN
ncbi:hypothetical protein [Propionimicrobium sp. PCR01-08-3]|uniref:hypothetical protein n=1 Tax=Propionimicrobium sp. PCR01-08-3 TaxID=3052086 RepID=UPI00255C3AB3|nr:hypothetical protein [Propionimicrobium sp. PCR01-08-3]WIY83717.1 hypothetical protein QQ658_05025 [Propionimicrobium sp. PCR01-08-3]